MTRPTWAEISRKALLSNYAYLRSLSPENSEVLAVVKADAYGHGLSHCAPIVAGAGATWLGVTSVDEGVRARALCEDAGLIKLPRILIMGGVWQGEAEALFEHDLTPVVWEDYHLDLIEAAARKFPAQSSPPVRWHPVPSIGVHLELDTGMSRQGIQAPIAITNSTSGEASTRLAYLLRRFDGSSPLRLEGVMTHFSAPEDAESNATEDQLDRLEAALELVTARGLNPRWLHAGSSATLINGGATVAKLQSLAKDLGARLMLRPGLSLYGYAPRFTPAGTALEIEAEATCKAVLAWKARVISIRTLARGETAGYNSTFRAARPTRLALLPVGYADGLNRLLSNRGQMLVRGALVPIAGRISMDQTILDVTDAAGVEIGDEVVILGTSGEASGGTQEHASISAYDHADLAGTIPWEVLCDIGARVPRILTE